MKFPTTILLLGLEYVFGASIYDADGSNFEDHFKRYESSHWRRDFGTRHCGSSQQHGGCMWASKENLKYVVHDETDAPWASSELKISMRNDCDRDQCCRSDGQCTSYSSGQLTSKQEYAYGTFYFQLRIKKDAESKLFCK